jgi:hypothetical protein
VTEWPAPIRSVYRRRLQVEPTDREGTGLRSGVRAWPSAAMLAGFLLVAAVQLALVVVPVLLVLAMLPGATALRLGVPLCTATVGVMAYATWRALRGRRTSPVGIPVGRADAPGLWTMLDGAAAVAGVAAPHSATVVGCSV